MYIPKGVNHLEFYKIAESKGIKVSSRFTGVSHSKNGRNHTWFARVQYGGKLIASKRFPFDEEGELSASNFYLQKLASFLSKK